MQDPTRRGKTFQFAGHAGVRCQCCATRRLQLGVVISGEVYKHGVRLPWAPHIGNASVSAESLVTIQLDGPPT